jgi:hypothetical protein
MSTQEAIKAYAQLAGEVFRETKWKGKDGMFKASKLEVAIKRIVKQYGMEKNEDESMLDTRPIDKVCRTLV